MPRPPGVARRQPSAQSNTDPSSRDVVNSNLMLNTILGGGYPWMTAGSNSTTSTSKRVDASAPRIVDRPPATTELQSNSPSPFLANTATTRSESSEQPTASWPSPAPSEESFAFQQSPLPAAQRSPVRKSSIHGTQALNAPTPVSRGPQPGSQITGTIDLTIPDVPISCSNGPTVVQQPQEARNTFSGRQPHNGSGSVQRPSSRQAQGQNDMEALAGFHKAAQSWFQSLVTQQFLQPALNALHHFIASKGGPAALVEMDNSRINLIKAASSMCDGFFLAIHQIYALYTLKSHLMQSQNGLAAIPDDSFKRLASLIRDNDLLSLRTIRFFSCFPVNLENLSLQELSSDYVQKIIPSAAMFLQYLNSTYSTVLRTCLVRDTPPTVKFLAQNFALPSASLQKIVFTAICRTMGISDAANHIQSFFTQSQIAYGRLYSRIDGPQSPTRVEIANLETAVDQAYAQFAFSRKQSINHLPNGARSAAVNNGSSTSAQQRTHAPSQRSQTRPPPTSVRTEHVAAPVNSPTGHPAGAPGAFVMPDNQAPRQSQHQRQLSAQEAQRITQQLQQQLTYQQRQQQQIIQAQHNQLQQLQTQQQFDQRLRIQHNSTAQNTSRQSAHQPPAISAGSNPQSPASLHRQQNLRINPSLVLTSQSVIPTNPLVPAIRRPSPPPGPVNTNQIALHQAHLSNPQLKAAEMPNQSGPLTLVRFIEDFAASPVDLPNQLGSVTMTFEASGPLPDKPVQVDPHKPLVISLKKGSKFYRLRCVKKPVGEPFTHLSQWSTADHIWPAHICFQINGQQNDIRRRTHHSKDLPIDLTSSVQIGPNSIKCTVFGNPDKDNNGNRYMIGVELIETEDCTALIDSVTTSEKLARRNTTSRSRNPPILPNSTSPNSPITSTDSDDLTVLSSHHVVNVSDPFSFALMDTPVRSLHCKHQDCFDLKTYISSRRPITQKVPSDSRKFNKIDDWKCPICSGDARPPTLRIDGWLQEVITELREKGHTNVKAIIVKSDGRWEPKHESNDDDNEPLSRDESPSAPETLEFTRKHGLERSASVEQKPNLDSMSTFPSVGRGGGFPAKKKTRVVIDLCDD